MLSPLDNVGGETALRRQPKIAFDKVGYGTPVMVLVRLEARSKQSFVTFESAVAECPSVVSCHLLSGGEDYLITLRARDLSDFERIHCEELAELPGVTRMQSLFALREVISRAFPPSLRHRGINQRPSLLLYEGISTPGYDHSRCFLSIQR
ncbi:Lrp/AsnC family transcriptional regulator [Novosphingobium sp. Gsoil 351]|uniref:Lrp/AsnC family transcriptional regulator n=1 Tax=Novosphingobium sp. Gsoil 351 TaxID=2675225 RepID=UPI0018A85596|nr:Lrp/AsnC family transcriptional regulator [Novosphingobium sp. Gsoil 351]